MTVDDRGQHFDHVVAGRILGTVSERGDGVVVACFAQCERGDELALGGRDEQLAPEHGGQRVAEEHRSAWEIQLPGEIASAPIAHRREAGPQRVVVECRKRVAESSRVFFRGGGHGRKLRTLPRRLGSRIGSRDERSR